MLILLIIICIALFNSPKAYNEYAFEYAACPRIVPGKKMVTNSFHGFKFKSKEMLFAGEEDYNKCVCRRAFGARFNT